MRDVVLIDPGTYSYLDASYVLDNGVFQYRRNQYSTDVLANRSVEFLKDAMSTGEPFFLGITPIAPHANSGFSPPVPADRHKGLFPDAQVPRGPSFNPAQVSLCRLSFPSFWRQFIRVD
jgi:N-acetylglucosamine-6-sulfatase